MCKEIKKCINSKDNYELLLLLHYIINNVLLVPEGYITISLMLDELKVKGIISREAVLPFIALLYSSFVIDCKKEEVKKILYKKI